MKGAVVRYIQNHGSQENPVTNREMQAQLNLNEQAIRKKINEARQDGIPICSCSKGYYYSEDKGDILETIQSLMPCVGRLRESQSA